MKKNLMATCHWSCSIFNIDFFIKKLSQFASATLLIVASNSCYSYSCYGLSDHFFVQCVNGICAKAFLAKEVPARGLCQRRIIVEDIPYSIIESNGKEVFNVSATDGKTHIFHIVYSNKIYDKSITTAEEKIGNIRNKNPLYVQEANSEVLAKYLNFEQLKAQWLEKSSNELFQERFYAFMDIGGLLCGSILLVFTLMKYRAHTNKLYRELNIDIEILKPLLIQVGLLCFGLIFWLYQPDEVIYIYLLSPIIIIVMAIEAIIYNEAKKQK